MTTINLSNLYKIDAEDLVYFVAEHLLKQNKKSIQSIEGIGSTLCSYRASDGNSKCAVGSVISDSEYSKEMEGKSPFIVYDVFFEKFYREKYNSVSWMEKIAEKENIDFTRSECHEIIDSYRSNFDNNMCILEKMRMIHDDRDVEEWESELLDMASGYSETLVKRIYAIER